MRTTFDACHKTTKQFWIYSTINFQEKGKVKIIVKERLSQREEADIDNYLQFM